MRYKMDKEFKEKIMKSVTCLNVIAGEVIISDLDKIKGDIARQSCLVVLNKIGDFITVTTFINGEDVLITLRCKVVYTPGNPCG